MISYIRLYLAKQKILHHIYGRLINKLLVLQLVVQASNYIMVDALMVNDIPNLVIYSPTDDVTQFVGNSLKLEVISKND
jgi:hypothetical protein